MADPMSPAAAALMRPAGVAPVLASPPAAVPADPAVALAPRVAVLEVLEVPVDSAVGRAAASVEAGAADGNLRIAAPAQQARRIRL